MYRVIRTVLHLSQVAVALHDLDSLRIQLGGQGIKTQPFGFFVLSSCRPQTWLVDPRQAGRAIEGRRAQLVTIPSPPLNASKRRCVDFCHPRLFVCIPPLRWNHELFLAVSPHGNLIPFTVLKVWKMKIKDGEREGALVVLGAIKVAHARTRRRNKSEGRRGVTPASTERY